jgi:DNA polymerase-3 subunit epsilon
VRLAFRSPAWDSVTYWSIDLETGGLDARRDALLAVGMVPVRGGIIHQGVLLLNRANATARRFPRISR